MTAPSVPTARICCVCGYDLGFIGGFTLARDALAAMQGEKLTTIRELCTVCADNKRYPMETPPSVPTAEEFAKAREAVSWLRFHISSHQMRDHVEAVRSTLASAEAAIERLREQLVHATMEQARLNVKPIVDREREAAKEPLPDIRFRADGMTPSETFEWMRRRIYDELEPEVQRLSKEAARLDWLDEKGRAMGSAIEFDHGIYCEGAFLRDAIDAAMSAGVSPPESP